jgi:hypothetical protein
MSKSVCDIISQPEIVPVNSSEYLLSEHFICRIHDLEFVIFKGFVFDGASIPRWTWSLLGLGPVGPHLAAACLHDFLYENRGQIPEHRGSVKQDDKLVKMVFSRKEADDLFKEILKLSCLSSFRVWAMYRAVRIFGQKAWDT